jgi:hypothetical protein
LSRNETTKIITDLRLIFIIQNLLDYKKKPVKILVDEVNKSIENYFRNYEHIKQTKFVKLTPATINAILLKFLYIEGLNEDGIFDREIMPDKYREKSCRASYRYWLYKDMSIKMFKKAYLEIGKLRSIGNKNEYDKIQDFITAGCNFLNSKLANRFLNVDLFDIEPLIKESKNIHLQEYIIKIAKISPTALLMIFIYSDLFKLKVKNNKLSDKKAIVSLLNIVENALINDVHQPSFSSKTNFELNQDILLKETEHEEVDINCLVTTYNNRKINNSLSLEKIFLIDKNTKVLRYDELLDYNSYLNDLLLIVRESVNEVSEKKPEFRIQFNNAIKKRENKIEVKSSQLKSEFLKSKIDYELFINLFED